MALKVNASKFNNEYFKGVRVCYVPCSLGQQCCIILFFFFFFFFFSRCIFKQKKSIAVEFYSSLLYLREFLWNKLNESLRLKLTQNKVE